MKRMILSAALLAGLAACGSEAGNQAENGANVATEEGLQDPNMIISGDELSPIPEAEDDMAANATGASNVAAPRNDAAPQAVPPPPPQQP